MYTIGLDISTTQTGYTVIKDGRVIYTAVIKPTDKNKMAGAIIAKLNVAIGNISSPSILTVVIESYTNTMTQNDRAGVSGLISQIYQTVTHHLRSRGVAIATVLPWSWRSEYELPTKVLPKNTASAYSSRLARSCGHNILKDLSIQYVRDHYQELGMTADQLTGETNDEAEAILIAQSYNHTRILNNTASYINTYYASDEDLNKYKGTVPVNTAKTWGVD